MQRSQISDYFQYLSQERITLLKVFLIDDLRSTTDDHKKIESLQQQYQHGICDWMKIKILKEQEECIHTSTICRALAATIPSIPVLALPDRDEVFEIGADITGVEIITTLLQAGQTLLRTEAHHTLQTRLLIYKAILIATKAWYDTGQQHEEVKMGPGKSQFLPTSDSEQAHTTGDLIRGQPSFQKKT
ncbi:hypothetical protein B296_00007580 [Ensete ventricosum]|uniref:Uncharacterized protein n=1 Tax=Ensete ventricosum TaxID=4639 RepID=A0A427BBN7_ENSVE|nr:hypothetical protein B296_00007580 [Ensete ventricosum]